LNPADPDGAPIIDPEYFTDDRDVAALAAAVGTARTIGEQPALRSYGLNEFIPGA